MIKIEIEDGGIKEALEKLQEYMRDRRPLMREIAGIMLNAVEENFAQEGRPRWKPLSPRTIKAREKKGYWPGAILQMRGELAASISTYSDKDSAVVGTNKVYAGIHQFGGKAGRGKKVEIPARPFLLLIEEDLMSIKEVIIRHFSRI